MVKTKPSRRRPLKPLADGQSWRVDGMILRVSLVGKLLVQYKLGKPNAIRMSSLVDSKATLEKYLKKNKAVLMRA